MQGPHRKLRGAEELVPAERAADQAVELGRTGAVGGGAENGARVRARRGRIVVVRLEHRDGEEVGAVGPHIEVGERIYTLGRIAVDGAIRAYAIRTGIGAMRHPGITYPVID